jgi:capsular exopolysaccharide synthesis family protein
MRRAGHSGDEGHASVGDDRQFDLREEDAADADTGAGRFSGEAPSTPDGQQSAPIGQLVPRREHVVPVRVRRKDGDGDIRFSDALGALARRRWLMIAVIALALAGAVAYNQFAIRIYEAHARLLIEPNSPDVVPFRGVTEDQGRLDYYLTQLEVLRSRALAKRTLETLGLLDEESSRQAGQISKFLADLTVAPVHSSMGDSRVINVTVTNVDATRAATLANGLAQAYVEQNLEARRQGSRDASEWLNQRLEELRVDLGKSEAALQHYREQRESVSLGEDHNNITLQKLAQLNSFVTNARNERLEKQALYDQLQQIQEGGQPLDTFTPILTNSFVQGLKADLAGLQRDKERMSHQLGDLHPDMVKVNAAIETATKRLNDEMSKIVFGVEHEYKAAEAKERSLAEALEAQKREVLQLNQASIGYTTLQRDASSNQQMFQTVLQRMKEMDLSAELQANNARILDRAEVPLLPIWPKTQLNLLIALLGGAFAGAVSAFAIEYLKPRIAMASDVDMFLGLPLLGTTPRIRGLKKRIAHEDLPASFQEAVRGIRTQLFLSPIPAAARSITVTSTVAGEGKTMLATNLAMSIAMTGRRVLLVDADMRRPQVHNIFGVPRSPGLSDVMVGDTKPTDALVNGPVRGLFLLPAGVSVANPTDLLDSGRLMHLISGFTHVFDTVVLDCPPVTGVADAAVVANTTASVVFVIGSGKTSPEAAQSALERIAAVQGQVAGVVLNSAKMNPTERYSYVQAEVVS